MPLIQNQAQPFFIKFILKPHPQTDFIYKLIQSYSIKLQEEYPQFQSSFREKQQKLLRHKQKLKQINEMTQDQILRDKILQEIQLKQYQKEYQKILNSRSNLKLQHKIQGKQNKTFHCVRKIEMRQSKQNMSIYSKNTTRQNLGKQQLQKKFRSSIIKRSSFSAIKRRSNNKSSYGTKNEKEEKIPFVSIRNSQQIQIIPNKRQYGCNELNLDKNMIKKIIFEGNTIKKGKKQQKNGNKLINGKSFQIYRNKMTDLKDLGRQNKQKNRSGEMSGEAKRGKTRRNVKQEDNENKDQDIENMEKFNNLMKELNCIHNESGSQFMKEKDLKK